MQNVWAFGFRLIFGSADLKNGSNFFQYSQDQPLCNPSVESLTKFYKNIKDIFTLSPYNFKGVFQTSKALFLFLCGVKLKEFFNCSKYQL